MPDEITQRVLHVIADAQRLPPDKVTVDKTFQELGIDSMDGVSLLFALENEFDINIPDDAAKSIRSVQDMVDGVKAILSGAVPGAAASATHETSHDTPQKTSQKTPQNSPQDTPSEGAPVA